MRRKAIALASILLLLLPLLLPSCAEQDVGSIGNEKTAPLDRILEAVAGGSVAAYEAAFPPDFCDAYLSLFPDLPETVRLQLSLADSYNCSTCGDEYRLWYELTGSETYDLSQLEETFQYDRLDRFRYTMSLSDITAAEQIHVTVHWEGSYDRNERDAVYLVLCIGGIWYLHPQCFGTVLRN